MNKFRHEHEHEHQHNEFCNHSDSQQGSRCDHGLNSKVAVKSECECDTCNAAKCDECEDLTLGNTEQPCASKSCISSEKTTVFSISPNNISKISKKRLKSYNCTVSNSGCGCTRCADAKIDILNSAENSDKDKSNKITLTITFTRLSISIILLVLGIFIKLPQYFNLLFFIPSFLFAGGEYVYKAVKNILHGKIFDENFLMTIASIGAFCIGEFPEGIAVMLLYSVGEMLQDYAVDKSKRNIADMLNLKTPFANKVDNGNIVKIATDDIQVGDFIVVASGEKIPVDGKIINGDSFVDNSMLNGEYKPTRIIVGDEILGGGILKGGAITIQATKLFKDTSASKIIELVQNSQDKKPKTEQFITKFAKIYTPIVVLIALLIALIPPAIFGFSQFFSAYLNKALVFLVVSCPCALVISVPLGFFAGIGGASKRGVLFKGGNYLEALSGIDTFAFDKTGTLTEGVFEVSNIEPINIEKSALLELCAYAESKSNHPIAESIRKAYGKSIDITKIEDYNEIAGFGITLKIDDSDIICGSKKLLATHDILVPDNTDSSTIIHIAKDGIYCGYITISDKIKPESFAVISKLLAMKKRVILLSGDRKQSVEAIAKQLNITDFRAELLPQDKASIITDLVAKGKKVAFVGDGLNDAPVLKLSTLGVCMSGLNNDASIQAADLILSNGKIGGLLTAMKSARKTRAVVSVNIVMALAVKLVIMVLSLTVYPSMWLALVADVGVSLLAILNSVRAINIK